MSELRKLRTFIERWMRAHADERMPYHDLAHTLDVAASARRIAVAEGLGEEDAGLLDAAALLHDVGHHVSGTDGHEQASCRFARQHLPDFGFDAAQIERICGAIMATKMPQSPGDALERVLCDADLDYLGRPDFAAIGMRLFREMQYRGELHSEREWQELQDRFLGAHHYHTAWSRQQREPVKRRHHAQVLRWLKQHR